MIVRRTEAIRAQRSLYWKERAGPGARPAASKEADTEQARRSDDGHGGTAAGSWNPG